MSDSRRFGRPHVHFVATDSTNERAKAAALAGAPDGTVVTAGEQSAGRGRQGRTWSAPPGSGLLASVISRPFKPGDEFAPLAAAVAVAEAAEQVADVQCRVKWPNDVWIDGRKLAGILLEARPGATPDDSWLVIGIGVNAALELAELPAELQGTAATLGLGSPEPLLEPLLERLGVWLGVPDDQLLDAFRARDCLRGRQISWAQGSGIASGIDDGGNLLVETGDGQIVPLRSGEVHLQVGG